MSVPRLNSHFVLGTRLQGEEDVAAALLVGGTQLGDGEGLVLRYCPVTSMVIYLFQSEKTRINKEIVLM